MELDLCQLPRKDKKNGIFQGPSAMIATHGTTGKSVPDLMIMRGILWHEAL